MAEDALVAVALRNRFYKDSQRKVILALLAAIIINLLLVSVLIYIVTHPPAPQYFATSINGRITPLVPLNMPNQSDAAVKQWANLAAIATYSFDFVNYRDNLQAASSFFTAEGWRQFLISLSQSKMLAAVTDKKLIVSAVALAAPTLLDKGVMYGGNYSWRIQMPILVTYQSASAFYQEKYVITLLITRVSTLDNPKGIGISQIVVAPWSGEVGQ